MKLKSIFRAIRPFMGDLEVKIDRARQIYRDITTNASLKGTAAVAQAKQRLETMADYQQKVVFKALPKPLPAESVQPQIKLEVTDTNTPSQ